MATGPQESRVAKRMAMVEHQIDDVRDTLKIIGAITVGYPSYTRIGKHSCWTGSIQKEDGPGTLIRHYRDENRREIGRFLGKNLRSDEHRARTHQDVPGDEATFAGRSWNCRSSRGRTRTVRCLEPSATSP
ncbi:hypothetical protein L484_026835 [Morus notabilis]|uniref:Uncharacterized protein n=1 Tax=Morus notabilis TaxID=981085 RepID=W9R5W0_9ROSA|nr:hypothetical protein L484_026835 [Morus notabilis]